MRTLLRRIPIIALSLAWAACSDSPVDPSGPLDAPGVAEAPPPASAATDAASLQAALDIAAGTGGTVIVQGTIVLTDPLTYASDADLTLMGHQDARIVGLSRLAHEGGSLDGQDGGRRAGSPVRLDHVQGTASRRVSRPSERGLRLDIEGHIAGGGRVGTGESGRPASPVSNGKDPP